jgi:C1A family cysteine protease
MLNLVRYFLVSIVLTVTTANISSLHKDSSIINKFKNWLDEFEIKFRNEHHLVHIFENWLNNDKFIELTNSQNLSYTLGHNPYSGLNSDEFSELMGFKTNQEYLNLRGPISEIVEETVDVSSLPQSVDWRTKNVVTPVKDQGQCGSCWSFSSTGALEGAYGVKYGSLLSFSEQQLVDCDFIKAGTGGRNLGCNGGEMDSTLQWIGKNGGLCLEKDYPYVSGTSKTEGTCQKTCSKISDSTVKSVTYVTVNSDTAMMTALAKQPVSVAIEADQMSFQLYKSGVFSGTCGTNLDHGVLLVGYTENAYILKNSWSSSWGDNGYIYLGRGNDPATSKPYNNGNGQCGVLMQAVYPNL